MSIAAQLERDGITVTRTVIPADDIDTIRREVLASLASDAAPPTPRIECGMDGTVTSARERVTPADTVGVSRPAPGPPTTFTVDARVDAMRERARAFRNLANMHAARLQTVNRLMHEHASLAPILDAAPADDGHAYRTWWSLAADTIYHGSELADLRTLGKRDDMRSRRASVAADPTRRDAAKARDATRNQRIRDCASWHGITVRELRALPKEQRAEVLRAWDRRTAVRSHDPITPSTT